MKMWKSRRVWIAGWTALLLLALTACGGGKADNTSRNSEAPATAPAAVASETPDDAGQFKEPVEITWALQGAANELEGWQAMIDVANEKLKEKKITIKIQKINTSSWDEYYQKMTAQMAAGNIPDMGRIAEELMPQVISKDQVVDLTPYLSELDLSSYFEGPLYQNAANKDGKTYGLPSGVYQMLLYYNKDLFDAKGIPYPSTDWNHPTSLEEVREIAKKLTEGTGTKKTFGFAAGLGLFDLNQYASKYLYNKDGTHDFSDSVRQTMSIIDAMLKQDKSMPNPSDQKVMGSMDMFRAGRIGMTVDGTWWHQSIRETKNFRVGIAAIPSLGGQKGRSNSFIDQFVIWKGTKHEKEAWEALKALFSEEAIDALAKTGTGGVPVNKNTLDKLQNEMIGSIFTEEDRATFIKALDFTAAMPFNLQQKEIAQKQGAINDSWTNGKKSVDETIADWIKLIEEVHSKSK